MKSWLILSLIGATIASDVHADDGDYFQNIKPLFAEKCNSCHGALKQKAGLRLDAGSLILKGGKNGPVVEPGNADESLILERVTNSDSAHRMPPEGVGEPLSPKQIADLKKWIEQGATIPGHEAIPGDPREHWAYQNPRKVTPPEIGGPDLANPVDRFIRHKQQQLGLGVVEIADRHAQLRRLYFDLIGLPPTRKQLNDFLNDKSPDAWEKTVDDLLDSPQYGERWGRHFMDIWRYSDWDGYKQELRGSQRHIWRWRDWIVNSLNADKPYDQMIIEMLAADEMEPTNSDILAATGFLARNFHVSNRNIWLDATVEHTAKAFLGMTLNCARCHDHKYDPIPQQAYYEFRAIFEPHQVRTDRIPGQLDIKLDGLPRAYDADLSVATFLFENGNEKKPLKDVAIDPRPPAFLGGDFQIQPVPLPGDSSFPAMRGFVVSEQRSIWGSQLIAAETKLKQSAIAQDDSILTLEYAALALEYGVAQLQVDSFDARIAAEKVKIDDPDDKLKVNALATAAASTERKLNSKRAELEFARKEIALKKIQASKQKDATKQQQAVDKSTKELATAKKKLQEARAVLSKQDANFTPMGKHYPTTSSGRRLALARWIASKDNSLTARVIVNQIWMRHFGAPLVENVFDFGLRSARPNHVQLLDWLAVELMENGWSMKHLHRLMVQSQTWRQVSTSQLAHAPRNREIDPDNKYFWHANPGRLDAEAIRDNVLAVAGQIDLKLGGPDIDFRKGESTRRRSIYLRHAYEKQMRMLVLFDAANPNECYRRSESIVPQQALALINSSLCLDQSRLLARQLWTEAATHGDDPKSVFLDSSFLQILGRPPTQREIQACQEFLDRQADLLSNTKELSGFVGGSSPTIHPAKKPESRARENLIHVLMNHNDFVTVR